MMVKSYAFCFDVVASLFFVFLACQISITALIAVEELLFMCHDSDVLPTLVTLNSYLNTTLIQQASSSGITCVFPLLRILLKESLSVHGHLTGNL